MGKVHLVPTSYFNLSKFRFSEKATIFFFLIPRLKSLGLLCKLTISEGLILEGLIFEGLIFEGQICTAKFFTYSCNNITTTLIQISRLFYFGFFSKTNHQMII